MKRSKKKQSGLRYIGRGAHLDVPRRDLTPDEVAQFGRKWLLSLRCPNTGGLMYAEEISAEPIEETE
jgi:hypothetical protein